MPITLYDASIPTFRKGLNTLLHILEKAEEHAKQTGIKADDYVTAALCEDMKPLSFQVQVVSNTVKKSVWRVTGDEIESWEDNESTMAQLTARVKKTLDLLKNVSAEKLIAEDTAVELQMGKMGSLNLPAKDYIFNYALPNFFFHVQTAYSILRLKGVPLGKSDYLTAFMKEKDAE